MYYEIHEKINLDKLEKCIRKYPESKDIFEKYKKPVFFDYFKKFYQSFYDKMSKNRKKNPRVKNEVF